MQAGTTYIERHNQVNGIIYGNIYLVYVLDPPKLNGRFLKDHGEQ